MASLTGTQIANTYKQLLQVGSGNVGLGGTLQTVQDGSANNSPLQLSTNAVNINGTFQLSGVTLTASASTLNAVADLTGATGLVAVSAGNVYGRTLVAGTGITIGNANGTEGNPTIAMVTATTSGSYKGPNDIEVNAVGQIVSISPAVSVSVATIKSAAFEGGTFVGSTGGFSSNVSIGDDLVVRGDATLQRITVSAVALTRLSATSGEFSGTVSAGFFAGDGRFLTNVPLPSSSGTMQKLTSGTGINLTIDGVVSTTIATSGTVNLNANQSFGIVSATNIDADELLMAGVSAANVTEVAAVSVLTSVNLAAITSINSVIGDGTGFVTDAELAAVSVALATSIGNSNTRITSVSDYAVALSATMATSIGNSNTNITTNANAITSINSVIGDGTGFATDAELAAVSATLATSIGNSNTTIAAVSVLTSVNLAAITSITAINTQDVTLTGTPDYITISNQVITRNQIDLTADVTGNLPVGNLNSGTGASDSSFWRGDGVWASPSGSGDVVGPASSTDNAIVRFDSTTGKLLQNSTVTISDAGAIAAASLTLTTDLAIADGGTGASSAGAALTALGAAASGANADITSLTGLTTDLTVAQGGTGAGTFTANGILFGNGTSAIGATAVGTSGHVLTSNGAGVAPTFQAAAAGGATDINGLSDALTNSSGATIGLGTGALAADDGSANNNTALGYQALNDATTAAFNVAVGYQAMDSMTTSYGYSTAVGYQALGGATTGFGHVAIGYQALNAITGGENHTAVGREAGKNASGQGSVFIGLSAGDSATGSNSVYIGRFAARNAPGTTTAVGSSALQVATGAGNTAIGEEALNDTTTGYNNTALGYQAGDIITTGYKNTTLGNLSAGGLTTGHSNTILGAVSGAKIATGTHNVAVGVDALEGALNMSGSYNIGIGLNSLNSVSSGGQNVALGYDACKAVTTGSHNIALGNQSLYNVTTGSENVAIGNNAMYIGGTAATNCVAVGHGALVRVTGNTNTAVGTDAGNTTTSGTNNTFLGFDAEGSSATVSNEITLGNASVTSFRIPGVDFYISSGNVGIGTSSPSYLTHLYSTSAEPKLVIEDASSGAGRGGIVTGTWGGNGIRLDSLNAAGWVYVGGSNTSYIPFTIGTEKARFHSNGNFGIGTTSPDFLLDVAGRIGILEGTLGIAFHDGAGSVSAGVRADSGDNLIFATGSSDTERMRIDSSGNVGIGTASPSTLLHLASTGNAILTLEADTDNVSESDNARIELSQDGGATTGHMGYGSGTNGIDIWNDYSDYVRIGTNNVERLRITNVGSLLVGQTSSASPGFNNTTAGGAWSSDGTSLHLSRSSNGCAWFNRSTTTGSVQSFRYDGTGVGTISVTGSSTAYNTSSDYRLKENIVALSGAIDRVKLLNPSRFNFIADPDTTVDGFVAHEVSDVVPEAICGEKDAVDAEGNPEYQGIDQSKLVPVLTAALQEALTKIEALEARIVALETA